MKKRNYLFLFILLSCSEKPAEEAYVVENPPAEGFDATNSDPRAIEIADQVMRAMGGREQWDDTRFICWNFFGSRQLIWDKQSGNVRIDSRRDTTTYLINIFENTGRVMRQGAEVTEEEELSQLIDRGKRIWINDSYWLVMPYKLKDSGVTLKWLRDDTTLSGIPSDVLELRFRNVGVTPDNRYEVWVSKDSSMVRQWAYYRYDTLQEPGFILPWDDWQRKGEILLSGNRGERSLTDIHVFESLPESTFSSFEPVNLNEY